jgi:hypothetical protein
MTSGRLRLALTGSQLTVMHDCGVGALDPTCLACYWKKYDFQIVRSWRTLDTIKIQTGQHLLRLVNGASVTLSGPASAGSRNDVLAIRFASGHVCDLRFPLEAGTRVERIAIHDLTGRTLAAVSLQPLQRDVQFPRISHNGVLILCCSMSNGTKISTRIPVVSE